VLVIATMFFAGLYRVADGAEKHSYNSGAVPPSTVELTQGHSYEISVRGGRKALQQRGITTTAAECTWSEGNTRDQVLTVSVLSADVRPTHALATFEAPVGGRVHIECAGWNPVFVDDADNSGWDYAGLFLVLTAVCLTLAVAAGLSGLYTASLLGDSSRDDDEIEAGLEAVAGKGEVGGADSGDVAR